MPNTKRQTHHRQPHKSSSPQESDKKAHTAGIGILLILLTNYQAEIKQIVSALLKGIT
jgi:hypothetical protein